MYVLHGCSCFLRVKFSLLFAYTDPVILVRRCRLLVSCQSHNCLFELFTRLLEFSARGLFVFPLQRQIKRGFDRIKER